METLQKHFADIDPTYWVIAILCSFIYAILTGIRSYKIDAVDPHCATVSGDWMAIVRYYFSPAVVGANLCTLLLSFVAVIIITLNQDKPGILTNMSAGLIASSTLAGNAALLSVFTGLSKIKNFQSQTKDGSNP